MEYTTEGISFSPTLPQNLLPLRLNGIKYRQMTLNIHIQAATNTSPETLFLPAAFEGTQDIVLVSTTS